MSTEEANLDASTVSVDPPLEAPPDPAADHRPLVVPVAEPSERDPRIDAQALAVRKKEWRQDFVLWIGALFLLLGAIDGMFDAFKADPAFFVVTGGGLVTLAVTGRLPKKGGQG